TGTFSCTAKFRYRQEDSPVEVTMREDGTAYITFAEPVRAITPGQAVVLYDGDICLGGGTIDEVFKNNEKLTYVG
ncbi:MAG: aminomethyltransferase beta-barrel domain-containing protein, partial [Solibacillus sp.]